MLDKNLFTYVLVHVDRCLNSFFQRFAQNMITSFLSHALPFSMIPTLLLATSVNFIWSYQLTLPMETLQSRSEVLHHVSGPIFLGLSALTYNIVAFRLRKPTISQGVRWIVEQGGGAEVAGAVLGGLLAHWLLTDGKKDK